MTSAYFLIIGIVVALAQRRLMRHLRVSVQDKRTRSQRNIRLSGRILRFGIASALLVYAIFNDSAVAYLFSGYTYYEAFARWCGLNALLGRNSCPIE